MSAASENIPAVKDRRCGACCTKLIDVSVRLGKEPIIEGVNLHMHCGELTAAFGTNGAGKTTLLRAIVGELPYSGKIEFNPSGRERQHRLRIGYVPQKLDIDEQAPITVRDLFAGAISNWPIWIGYRLKTRTMAKEALDAVDAGDLLNVRVGKLSGGELQRVLLALALTPVPDILLLDEPVAGIDQTGISLFYRRISQLREMYDLSILLVSHDLLPVARIADRLVVLNRKVLAEGAPRDVLSQAAIRELLGLNLPVDELASFARPLKHHPAGASGV